PEPDFRVRNGLDQASLVELFAWSEEEFLQRTEGSAIRRTGYEGWLRNLAVALGNAPRSPQVITALASRRDHPSDLVREHVAWALARHGVSRKGLLTRIGADERGYDVPECSVRVEPRRRTTSSVSGSRRPGRGGWGLRVRLRLRGGVRVRRRCACRVRRPAGRRD